MLTCADACCSKGALLDTSLLQTSLACDTLLKTVSVSDAATASALLDTSLLQTSLARDTLLKTVSVSDAATASAAESTLSGMLTYADVC